MERARHEAVLLRVGDPHGVADRFPNQNEPGDLGERNLEKRVSSRCSLVGVAVDHLVERANQLSSVFAAST